MAVKLLDDVVKESGVGAVIYKRKGMRHLGILGTYYDLENPPCKELVVIYDVPKKIAKGPRKDLIRYLSHRSDVANINDLCALAIGTGIPLPCAPPKDMTPDQADHHSFFVPDDLNDFEVLLMVFRDGLVRKD